MSAPDVRLVAGFGTAVTAGHQGSELLLVLGDGPSDAAAGMLHDRLPVGPRLWGNQVLGDGRLRAVVIGGPGPDASEAAPGFDEVHAAAERVADMYGLSAVDVAVLSTHGRSATYEVASRAVDGARLAGITVRVPGADGAPHEVRVLLTDAALDAATLRAVLARPADPSASLLLLAGGSSGVRPAADALAVAVREVCDDLHGQPISRETRS